MRGPSRPAFSGRVRRADSLPHGAATPDQPTLLQTLGQVFTVIAGAVAFVYLVGAGVLWVRLWREGLPTDAVISVLPRELIVAVGLRSIIVPASLLAPVAAIVLWAASRIKPSNLKEFVDGIRGEGRVGDLIQVLIALVLAGSWVVSFVAGGPLILLGWTVGFLVAVFTSAAIGLALQGRLSSLPIVALAALAVSSAAAAARVVVELKDPRLEAVKVCVDDGGDPYEGVLIGETTTAVYVGQSTPDRVLSVPRDRVGELWIGTHSAQCTVPEPTASGPAQPR